MPPDLPVPDDKVLTRIISLINKQTVIPIIGYDLLQISSAEGSVDLLKTVIKEYCKELIPDLNLKIDDSLTANQYVDQIYYQLPDEHREVFNVEVSNVIKKLRVNNPVIFEPLRKLARIKAFKFYVNATCTNAVEVAINTFRSTEPEAKKGYDIYGYRPSSADPLDVPYNKQAPLSVFKNPVIYNLMGVHGPNGDYVLTEPEYIELIYDLIRDKDGKFTSFKDLLSRTSLLFLGCNFEDWFFKFFIRICANDKVDKISLLSKAVIDLLKDTNRAEFITNYRMINVPGNSTEFIDRLYSKLKESNPELIEEQTNNNQIFISYCWDDKALVNSMTEQFQSIYLDSFWRDQEELETGNKLDPKITTAIESSSMVLFILPPNVQKEENKNRYFWDEWSLSLKLNKKIVIVRPSIVGDHILLPGSKLGDEEKEKIVTMLRTDIGIILESNNQIPTKALEWLKQKQLDSRIINTL